jgi:hypothetical protein
MDPDPAIFVIDLQDINKDLKFVCLLYHFSKIKSLTEATKQQESMFFLLFSLDEKRIQIRIRISD